MAEPKEVEGKSGMTYEQIEVSDLERGGTTTAVVPPSGEVYVRPSEGE